MISFEYEGKSYENWSLEDAVAAGIPKEVVDAAITESQKTSARSVVRGNISREAGDTLSLLGTTSDAATIAILVGACFMASLDEETSYAKFRAKVNGYMKALSGDHDPTEIAQAFLASLAAGEVRLPALEKGIVPVLAEVTARGTAVADAIYPSGGGEA